MQRCRDRSADALVAESADSDRRRFMRAQSKYLTRDRVVSALRAYLDMRARMDAGHGERKKYEATRSLSR